MVEPFVSYSIENDKQFKSNLDSAIKAVGDLRFPMGEISRDIYKTTKQNFILKGGGKYPALSQPYATEKKRTYPNSPILVRTGALRDSVTSHGDSESIRHIGKQSLVQGTNVHYAGYVQRGTKVGGKERMPERKYLFIDDAQSIRFTRILSDYVAAKSEVLGIVK